MSFHGTLSSEIFSEYCDLLGNIRFEYEYEFSLPVCRLYIVISHTGLFPGASFFTSKQHEEVRSLETSLVRNLKIVLVLNVVLVL